MFFDLRFAICEWSNSVRFGVVEKNLSLVSDMTVVNTHLDTTR